MTCPPRQYCPAEPAGCGEELIHRDHRKRWESSSGFGQIVNRDFGRGPFGFADVDMVFQIDGRGPDALPVLIVYEFKEWRSEWRSDDKRNSQASILRCLAIVIHDAVVARRLDPKSGVFVVRGQILTEANGHRKTYFGPTIHVERMLPMHDPGPQEEWLLKSKAELFDWMDREHGIPAARVTGRRVD